MSPCDRCGGQLQEVMRYVSPALDERDETSWVALKCGSCGALYSKQLETCRVCGQTGRMDAIGCTKCGSQRDNDGQTALFGGDE